MRCCRKHQGLVRCLIVARSCERTGLGHYLRAAIQELDYVWNVKDMLIEPGEEEDSVSFNGTANSGPNLLLPVMGFKSKKRVHCSKPTVTQVVKNRSM